jgi:hypothetical protein
MLARFHWVDLIGMLPHFQDTTAHGISRVVGVPRLRVLCERGQFRKVLHTNVPKNLIAIERIFL